MKRDVPGVEVLGVYSPSFPVFDPFAAKYLGAKGGSRGDVVLFCYTPEICQ